MLKLSRKDKKLRLQFLEKEQKNVILKSLTKNNNFSKIVRWNSGFSLLHNYFTSKAVLVNRCIFSGRNSKFNYYRFSRLSFLKFARNAMVPGIFKAPQ